MYTVGLLSAIALFNGIDLSILPAVSSLLQREFSLADYQVGALGAAYVLVYAFAVIPFGVWSDGGARSSGALSMLSNARYSAAPLMAKTLVIAAVSDVFP